jgi:hypothetical protein
MGCQHFIAVTSIIIEERHKNWKPEKLSLREVASGLAKP